MRFFKKIVLFLTILTFSILCIPKNNVYATSSLISGDRKRMVNAAVLLFKFGDPYKDLVKQSLENIEKENSDNINFTFFNGENSQAVQLEILTQLFSGKYDLMLIDLVNLDQYSLENIINTAKSTNKAVILFNVEPIPIPQIAKTYNKLFIIGTDAKQAGILQGQIIVDIWNNNKSSIDKNNNNVLEYIMLQGKTTKDSLARTKYSISTIEDAGIKTKELASIKADWDKELAKQNVDKIFLRFGNRIEAIISNNDAMAIGAIEAIQKYGYNTGDAKKNIAVVGIDGIPEAKELINKGIMSGTVIQDPNELAKALYTIGTNLVNNNPPLLDTNYKASDSDIVIEMPYHEYKKSS